jgi:hypothetical protein
MTAATENPVSGDNEKYCVDNRVRNRSGSYVKSRRGSTNRKDGDRI